MIDTVVDCIYCILAKQARCGPIILYEMVAGFAAVFIIAMQGHERGQALGITADPAIDPAQFSDTEAAGIAVSSTVLLQCCDARHNQLVEPIGGAGPGLEIDPGNRRLQPRVGHDCFNDSIQAGLAGGQICFERSQPAGHVTEGGIVGAVLIGEASGIGVEGEAEVIDAVQHRIDQGLAVELAIAAIPLNRVISSFDATFIVTMQGGEQCQAFGVRVIAHPGIQQDHISYFQHCFLQHTNRGQSLDQQAIEAIHSRESGGHGTGLIGARQAAIAGDPTQDLIEATAAAARWCVQIGRGGADRAGHGGDGDQGKGMRRDDTTGGPRLGDFRSS